MNFVDFHIPSVVWYSFCRYTEAESIRLDFTALLNSSPIATDYCIRWASRRAFHVERIESVRVNGCAFNSSPSATGSSRRSVDHTSTVGFNQLWDCLDSFLFTIVNLKMKSGTLKSRSFYLEELFSNFSWDWILDDKQFKEARAEKKDTLWQYVEDVVGPSSFCTFSGRL